jgi:hypothetical protein
MESLNALLIYMTYVTISNKSGIQIIQSIHFCINVTTDISSISRTYNSFTNGQ